ncbi:MAG: pentapeptide repeat-containing protein [Gemmataceae bacterium]
MFAIRVSAVVMLLGLGAAAAQDSFRGKNFDGVSFDKRNFKKGADFSETDLKKCNFSEAKLVEADFRKASIAGGYFLWADLSKADFRGAKLTKDVAFGAAILDGANLEGVDLSDCGFNVTKFRGANLRNSKGMKAASRCDFTDADLRGADLSNMKWPASDAQPKFTNARYDSKTVWPAAIDPATVGAKLMKDEPGKPDGTPPEPQAPQAGIESLKGVWNVVKRGGGESFPPVRLIIDGKKCIVVWEKDDQREIEIRVDSSTKPMRMDLGLGQDWSRGIYELTGDTLRVCWRTGRDAERPAAFLGLEGAVLLTLQRVRENDPLPPSYGSNDLLAEPLSVADEKAKLKLKSGFSPNPSKREVFAGGLDKTKLGGVSAFIGLESVLIYTAGKPSLEFTADCPSDTTLLVRLPDGTWLADDNSGGGVNPLIRVDAPESGVYRIYVGVPENARKRSASAELLIAEREPKPRPQAGEKALELAGTYWQLLSLTAKGEKITDADNPADVEFTKDGKWGILSGGGMRIAGTYAVKGERLVMTSEDGEVYLDAKMAWKPDTGHLELDTGKLLMRLKRIKPK